MDSIILIDKFCEVMELKIFLSGIFCLQWISLASLLTPSYNLLEIQIKIYCKTLAFGSPIF